MGTPDILNSKSLKTFIKGSLTLIGLLAVLYCGIAALIIFYGDNLKDKICTLILVLAIPLIVFLIVIIFLCLFKLRYKTHKLGTIIEACLMAAKAIKPDSVKDTEQLQKLLIEMLEQLSKISLEEKGDSSKYKILCFMR